MTDLDDKIRQALKGSGVDPIDFEEEGTLREQVFETFRGKHRWLTILVTVEQFIFFGITIFAAVKFFHVDSTRNQIFYATVFLACFWVGIAFKMWYWMLLNRNAVTREVKRLELQLAVLARRLPKASEP